MRGDWVEASRRSSLSLVCITSQLPPRQYLHETKDVATACASQDEGPAGCPPTPSPTYLGAKTVSDEGINVAP